jgi:hypothetical protein
VHYFGGLNEEEDGAVLKLSAPTVNHELTCCKAWLRNALDADAS